MNSDTDPMMPAVTVPEILRRGSNGPLVTRVQLFLRGRGLYLGEADGDFGPKTEAAVKHFQDESGLRDDGEIGNRTWGALMHGGLVLVQSDAPPSDRQGEHWPPPPTDFRPLSLAERNEVFGELVLEATPMPTNPEACRILSRSPEFKLVDVEARRLLGVTGFPQSGKVLMHAKAAGPFESLVAAWDDAGVLGRVISWGGSFAPRFMRGSKTALSVHSWGAAFDINVPQNPLGAIPALAGRRGSVRELVTIANGLGWFWGGHFSGRLDGMHFQLDRVGS